MKCLACGAEMTGRCACGAAWLPEDKLVDMAQDMKGAMVALPWRSRSGGARPCPVCKHDMLTVSLEDVALDRCKDHGIWFDANELQQVLQRADHFPDPRTPKQDWNVIKPVESKYAPPEKVRDGVGLLAGLFGLLDLLTLG